MRYFVLTLLTLLLLSSCSTSRIKKVRVIVSDNDIEKVEKVRKNSNDERAVIAVVDVDEVQSLETTPKVPTWNYQNSKPNSAPQLIENDENETVDEPTEVDERIALAYRAERHARRAYSNLMAAGITTGVSIVFPPLILASIILFIIGAIYYSRANRARYITEFGERRRKAAFVWLIVNIAFGVLFLLLATIVLLFIFL